MQHLTWHLKAMCHSSGKSPNNFLTRPLHKLNQDEIILIHQQDTGHQKREDHHGEERHIATLPRCHVATLPHGRTGNDDFIMRGEKKPAAEYGMWSFSLKHTDVLNYGQSSTLLWFVRIWFVIIFIGNYWCAESWSADHIAMLYPNMAGDYFHWKILTCWAMARGVHCCVIFLCQYKPK